MSRIIAGSRGGQRIAMPPGDRARPTTDRVREALFSAIAAWAGTAAAPVERSLGGLAFCDWTRLRGRRLRRPRGAPAEFAGRAGPSHGPLAGQRRSPRAGCRILTSSVEQSPKVPDRPFDISSATLRTSWTRPPSAPDRAARGHSLADRTLDRRRAIPRSPNLSGQCRCAREPGYGRPILFFGALERSLIPGKEDHDEAVCPGRRSRAWNTSTSSAAARIATTCGCGSEQHLQERPLLGGAVEMLAEECARGNVEGPCVGGCAR